MLLLFQEKPSRLVFLAVARWPLGVVDHLRDRAFNLAVMEPFNAGKRGYHE